MFRKIAAFLIIAMPGMLGSCNQSSKPHLVSPAVADSLSGSRGEFIDCPDGKVDSGYLAVTDDNGFPYYSKVLYLVCNGVCIYEGDMVIKPIHDTSEAKLVHETNVKKWPLQTVYYVYDKALTRLSGQDTVRKAMLKIWLLTNFEFKPASEGGPNVKSVVISDDGSWRSDVGYGENDTCHINLGYWNKKEIKGKIMHELLHTLGFLHEQSRPDRDKYIDTVNVKEGKEYNFVKLKPLRATTYGEYDFLSIMHYDNGATTDMAKVPGKPVILPKPQYATQAKGMGQRDSLTQNDIYSILKFYNLTPN